MSWSPHEQPVDKVLLSNEPSPGIAVVEGADSLRRLKERRGYGMSGAFVVFLGVPLVHFTVKLTLYTAEDWADWAVWKQLLFTLPRDRLGAFDIWHPVLEEIGVVAAMVESVGQPVQGDTGEWTVAVKFCEQRKPQLALATPEGAKATQQDPYDALIDANRARIAALAAQ
jgi:hypothetical protein